MWLVQGKIGLKALMGSYLLQSCSSAALSLPKNQAHRSSSKPHMQGDDVSKNELFAW